MPARIETAFRLMAGTFTAGAVALQYWLLMQDKAPEAMLASSVRFFSFFTILTNLLAAAALLVPVLARHSALGRFLARPSVRTAIAGYIVMVGTVYHLLLLGLSQRAGLPLAIELAMHYVTPPLFLLDWVLFTPKQDLRWSVGVSGLAFPLAYLAWTLAHGAASGWYPYPFVDVAQLGYERVLLNSLGLVACYLALEAVLVAISRLLQHRAPV